MLYEDELKRISVKRKSYQNKLNNLNKQRELI